jgi:Ca-activated chloride channel homolog
MVSNAWISAEENHNHPHWPAEIRPDRRPRATRPQVLVRIQAPDADPAAIKPRPPYHLALVIDHSGSMSGEPLHEAKRCARHIIDQLKPDDRASLIQFDNRVDVLVPANPVGDRKALHQALKGIEEGGNTNLHGGWEAGGQALLEHIQQAGLSRVILLSDGNANEGLTDTDRSPGNAANFAEHGASPPPPTDSAATSTKT